MQTENPSNAIVDPQQVQTMVAMDGSIEEALMIPPLNVFPAENLELISFKDDKYFMRKGLEGQGGRRSKVGDKVIETPAEKTKAEGKGIAKSIAKPTRSSPSLAPRKMDQGGGGLIILSDDSVMEPVESCTSIYAGK
ncbi:hypothetical protein AMTR_s01057p00001070, partial [Amborella trichopoda]